MVDATALDDELVAEVWVDVEVMDENDRSVGMILAPTESRFDKSGVCSLSG